MTLKPDIGIDIDSNNNSTILIYDDDSPNKEVIGAIYGKSPEECNSRAEEICNRFNQII